MNKKRMKKIVLTFVSLLMGGLCSVLVACSDEEHTVPISQKTAVEKLKLSPTKNTIGKSTVSQSWLIPIWYFFTRVVTNAPLDAGTRPTLYYLCRRTKHFTLVL